MKKQLFILSILISMVSCQSKSDCFGGRIIVDEIETVVKYEKRQESLFKEKEGVKYVACNYSDTLIENQNYKVGLRLLMTEPAEKWVGQPCEITKLEIQTNQEFELLEIEQKALFTGGSGKTEKGETIVVGLYITKKSKLEIEYEFTELIDWKERRMLEGKASFQGTNNDKIETRNGKLESAFRFVDSENNIEVFLTKDFQINQTKARLIKKNTSKMSGLMFNK